MKNNFWRNDCKNHIQSDELEKFNQYDQSAQNLFKLHVPKHYKNKINFADPNDPLLLQVLPEINENRTIKGYSSDPVGDLASKQAKGVIHKYYGRVLLITTGICAINCRYCFRRNFPYANNNAASGNWQSAIKYLKENKEVNEVILSGGDPLMASTKVLMSLTDQLQELNHIKTLRIHTRMVTTSPSRINKNLLNWLTSVALKKVLVNHINHPNELTQELMPVFSAIKNTNTTLLNQSVLLKNINNKVSILQVLSHKLFEYGILPYYLNQLDKVSGAAHFRVSDSKAKKLHKKLMTKLPGYLVPKLVKEISGKKNKTHVF